MTAPVQCKVTLPLIKRMRELRGIGLSAEAVSRLVKLDYGISLHKSTVARYAPSEGGQAHRQRGTVGIEAGAAAANLLPGGRRAA